MPGTINQYEIRQTLGSGFSCKVKLGVDTNTGRNVAIKIIREGDEELMDLVRTETQAMSKIAKHDHVVEQIEAGRAIYKKEPKNGMPGKEKEVDFIVLEICPGGEIFDFVAISGPFSEDQARYFFSQFIEGLLHCHNKGFAHRDLKPENLLLGENYDLKIADFGFAGPINGRGGVGYLETPLGTEAYMAPELIKKQKYRGAQVDIFAAAAVLFILVAQHPPFNKANEKDDPFYKMLAANRADLFWKQHCKHKPGKDKFFSDDFKDLIQSMLQLEASHRPSFSEILGHPWMKGNMPDKATIFAEFEKRHLEVKNNAALEKLEKEAERDQMGQSRGDDTVYRSVADFAKYQGQPLKKQIKLMEQVQESALHTMFICKAHPDHIEEVLLENLRDEEKVDPKISSEKYKVSFSLMTTDQGGLEQNTPILIKLHKVDDEHTAVEFQNQGGNQIRFYDHYNNFKKNVLTF